MALCQPIGSRFSWKLARVWQLFPVIPLLLSPSEEVLAYWGYKHCMSYSYVNLLLQASDFSLRADCPVLLSLHSADAVICWGATAATSVEMLFQHWWQKGIKSISHFLHALKALGSHILAEMELRNTSFRAQWEVEKLCERSCCTRIVMVAKEENCGEELNQEATWEHFNTSVMQFLTEVEISLVKHHWTSGKTVNTNSCSQYKKKIINYLSHPALSSSLVFYLHGPSTTFNAGISYQFISWGANM